jgi:4-amino-4-deoxy-L-arabinose transferase-like glycosyltransferase
MKKTVLILLIIISLGAFLRFYRLNQFPPALFGDEVDVGYQAYSILKTGKDYLGQPWPISFHSLADWRTPLFLYTDVPFIALFGLNEWGVRFPAALFGILTLPLFFLLLRKLFGRDEIGLLGTFFMAVSMWHLQYSRAAFEVTQMLFLLVGGLYFFFLGLAKWKYLFISVFLLALTPYSYNTAKFFLPLLLGILALCYWLPLKKIGFKRILAVGALFCLVSLPMVLDIVGGKGAERFSVLSVFSDPTVIPQIGFERQADMWVEKAGNLDVDTASLTSRFFHNKFLSWGLALFKNYSKVFSTEFLFTFGDLNLRHSVQGNLGVLYWLDLFFLSLGLISLANLKDKSLRNFLLLWLLLSPVPSVLTRDGGSHATRLILLLLPLLALISLGAFSLGQILRRAKLGKVMGGVIALVFIFQMAFYLHHYYVHYPLKSEGWWHYGFKELGEYVKENGDKYDYIVWSDGREPPLIFSLFWTQTDPRILQENKLVYQQVNDAIWADHLPQTKFYYGRVSEKRVVEASGYGGTLNPKILYLAPLLEIKKDFRREPPPSSVGLLKTIYYPSGSIAHYILTGL